MYKEVILDYLLKYLEIKKWNLQKSNKIISMVCPICGDKPAVLIPNSHPQTINCFKCKNKYTIIEVARKLENKPDEDIEEIYFILKGILGLDVTTEKDKENLNNILKRYEKLGWDLVPVAKDDKAAKIEKDWQNKTHTDIREWERWIDEGINLGVKTGPRSNIVVLDIDAMPSDIKKLIYQGKATDEQIKIALQQKKENLEKVLTKLEHPENNTLVQTTFGGIHLFYKYTEELPKTQIKIEGIIVDVETTGGQIVIAPSTVGGTTRKFNDKEIINIPANILEILNKEITVPRKTNSEQVREEIATENFKIDPADLELKNNNLEGCCNNAFIKLGGVLRKELDANQVRFALKVLNRTLLKDPMPDRIVDAMSTQLEKFVVFDEQELAHKVLIDIKSAGELGKNEIADIEFGGRALGENKRRLDKVLSYLFKEHLIIKKGREYKVLRKVDWKTELVNNRQLLDFKMPYFDDTMNFGYRDMLLIGGSPKTGKTNIAINIVQSLVQQGKVPYYFSLEANSRFETIALKMGLKEGDFKYCDDIDDPLEIEFEKNSVTIIDWLDPSGDENGFAHINKWLKHFNFQIRKTNSFLIVFMQLKQDDTWFSHNLITQHPVFAARYIYDDETGVYGKFKIDNIREPKTHMKTREIPCKYIWQTKQLIRVDELPPEEQKQEVKPKMEVSEPVSEELL